MDSISRIQEKLRVKDKNIGYNWVAGNGLNLDLDSDYMGVDIYK